MDNQSNGKQFLGQISDVNFIFYIFIRVFFAPQKIFSEDLLLQLKTFMKSSDIQRVVGAGNQNILCAVRNSSFGFG